jgi:exosortase D (VPLPA-CTERM-specific)
MIRNSIDNRLWWLPAAIVLSALVFSYWDTIGSLAAQMLANEDFSGGLLIVPMCIYLIWRDREKLKTLEVKPDWRALSVLTLAIVIFIVGELGAELFTTRVSMLIFVVGAVWLLYGPAVLKTLRFPLAFLFLMLPLPGFIYRNLTFPLQILSSTLSVNLLQALGISVHREGNVIDMDFTRFQVVEACNGLRFILPLLIIGVLMAFLSHKPMWKRLFLIAAGVPIAILANVIRIAGTGLIARQWGVEAAEGFFHSFSGWAVFMLCLGIFVSLNFVLEKIPGRHSRLKMQDRHPEKPVEASRSGMWSLRWTPTLAAAALVLVTPVIVDHLGEVPPVPLKQPLSEFPKAYGSWQGRSGALTDQVWEQVGGQEYVIINYFNGNQNPVNFYTAYYEYQRKAGDFIHSPKLCLPGAGWHIQQSRIRHLPVKDIDSNDGDLTFNEVLIQKTDTKQLVYYWYQGRGRNFTNEYLAKFYMVWDGVFRRRTDGALVRLIRTVSPDESLEDVRQVLDPFAEFVSRTLLFHLPD